MRTPGTLTVRELREALEDYKDKPEDDLPVFACYNYGDYANTPAVQPFGHVQVRRIQEEAYSHSGWGVAPEPGEDEDGPEDEDDINEEDTDKAVIISEFDYIPRGRHVR